MNPNEDTEWNDILRAKGILPPKEGPTEDDLFNAHDQAVREAQDKHLSDKDLDELDELEDEEDEAVLRHYRQQRMDEMKALADRSKYGELRQISEPDYKREVTEGSKDTFVVVHLFRDSLPACKLINHHLSELARRYPTVKFLKIVSTDCIHNYPDRNLPTLLIYGHGELQQQLVGMYSLGGTSARVGDLEAVLRVYGALPDAPAGRAGAQDESDEDYESDRGAKPDTDSDFD